MYSKIVYLSPLAKILLVIWVLVGLLRAIFFSLMIYHRKSNIKWYDYHFFTDPLISKTFLTEKGIYFRKIATFFFWLFAAITVAFLSSHFFYL